MPSLKLSDDLFPNKSENRRSPFSALHLAEQIQNRVSESGPEQAITPRLEIAEFATRYFGEHCEFAPSRFHREFAAELNRILGGTRSHRLAVAAPRGNAKTTWGALILPIYAIVYGLKHFIVLISNTSAAAVELVDNIKAELLDNELLRRDFPAACGRGRMWRGAGFISANGVRVQALGVGSQIRGKKHMQHRPDLFIFDDLENDEQVRSPEQREKLANWLSKAALNAKGIAKKADFIAIGTLLHFDSVLARLLDERKSPGWKSMRFRSIERFAENQALWDEWREIFLDFHQSREERSSQARRFFEQHKDEMLRGTQVLWPEAESYYELMVQRIELGPIAFDSEKQNEPIDPSECSFREDWFEWFRIDRVDGKEVLVPDRGDSIPLEDCDIFGSVDPSMGKHDKHRDPSAIVTIAAFPARHLERSDGYQLYWVLEADISRRHPHVIERDIIELNRLRRFKRFGVESVQFQELFADNIAQKLPDLHVVKLNPLTDKKLRIETLSRPIFTGQMKFNRKLVALYDQLRYWPQAHHDDGPDALELCMQTIKLEGWHVVQYESIWSVRDTLGPYDQQLFDQFPEMFFKPFAFCRDCLQFKLRPDGRGDCIGRGMIVKPDDPGCDRWRYLPRGPAGETD